MDLNVLLTTVITATAALVAILGGFLVSRVITLANDKSQIEKKIFELNGEIKIKKQRIQELDEKLEEGKSNLYKILPDHIRNDLINTPNVMGTAKKHKGELEMKKIGLKEEIHFMSHQINLYEGMKSELTGTSNIWWGLIVLLYATISGIIYPSLYLPFNNELYDYDNSRILFIILFFSHLFVLFIYLFFSVFLLTKKKKGDENEPSNPPPDAGC